MRKEEKKPEENLTPKKCFWTKKKLLFLDFFLILFLVLLDQTIKYFVSNSLEQQGSIVLWEGVLQLTYLKNSGGILGFLQNQTPFILFIVGILLLFLLLVMAIAVIRPFPEHTDTKLTEEQNIPEYSGKAYVEINDNKPFFEASEITTKVFESYSDLDMLGRCGVAYANIGKELLPTQERGEIGAVKPSGWCQEKYPGIVKSDPPYLYNRCHLIAFCLAGENDNEKNLITGTRYMNVEGMLPFEEKVVRYVEKTSNHVLYRVTPVFEGANLVASGVMMEAYSVEDGGKGICFCVYCYNVQPGIVIDYRTGKNREEL